MLNEFSTLAIGSFLTPIIAMLSGLIDIPNETRVRMVERFFQASVTSLRSNGVDTTYESLNIDIEKNQLIITNINLGIRVTEKFCNMNLFPRLGMELKGPDSEYYWLPTMNSTELDYWTDPCKINIRIGRLILDGIGMSVNTDSSSGVKIEKMQIDIQALNQPEPMSIKLATGLKDQLNGELTIKFDYAFNTNLSSISTILDIKELAFINMKIKASNLLFRKKEYSDDYYPEGILTHFDFRIEDRGLLAGLESLNALSGENPALSNQIQQALPPLNPSLEIMYPLSDKMVSEFTYFFTNGKSLECIRRHPHPFNNWIWGSDNSATFFLSFFCESVSVDTDFLGPQKHDEVKISGMIKKLREQIPPAREQKTKSLRQKLELKQVTNPRTKASE